MRLMFFADNILGRDTEPNPADVITWCSFIFCSCL